MRRWLRTTLCCLEYRPAKIGNCELVCVDMALVEHALRKVDVVVASPLWSLLGSAKFKIGKDANYCICDLTAARIFLLNVRISFDS